MIRPDLAQDAVKKQLVPMARIERATSPLPRECSTTEPHGHFELHCTQKARRYLERVKGIEPSSSAWKAVALPLSYTREERFTCRTPRITNHGRATAEKTVVVGVGFEPT